MTTTRFSCVVLGCAIFILSARLHRAHGEERSPSGEIPGSIVGTAHIEDTSQTPPIELIQFAQHAPLEPTAPPRQARPNKPLSESLPDSVGADLFAPRDPDQSLADYRRQRAKSSSADVVLGIEAISRVTTDTGNLLGQASSVRGVRSQQRNPVVTDTRIRGERVGQVLAAGSYWVPARMDLDTMMNKIDSRIINDIIVIKGPYSTRYGPGFNFVDIQLISSPRYVEGYETHGSTSLDYKTNGERWYGRQSIWGGSDDWGFRVSYGHRTGSDYETGAGFLLPTSYKSRDLDVAFGFDYAPGEYVEINYLRLDQTDVEFPGLVFDINFLVTDGAKLRYVNENTQYADRFSAEYWFNNTRFAGDTLREGKNAQIPTLRQELFSPSGMDGFAITDAQTASSGYRLDWSWSNAADRQVTAGTDLIWVGQELNDIEPLLPPIDNNFPLSPSRSTDVGFFVEYEQSITERLTVFSGARADIVATRANNFVPGFDFPLSDYLLADLDQEFGLGSAYVQLEYDLTPCWKLTSAVGFAERPPTLTELYVADSFIGALQQGLTFLEGDPLLDEEELRQIDVGLIADYGSFRGGLQGYYSWIEDYITYDLFTPTNPDGGLTNGAAFVNTPLATLAGFELYGECDVLPQLTLFGVMSYVEGWDRTRRRPSRLNDFRPRSDVAGVPEEPLPGIPPLDSRIGFRIYSPHRADQWGVEFSARIVDNQDRFAATLGEIATPGFTTLDVRSYWRLRENLLVVAGVENLTDKFYREHLDFRSGRGVFRPGVNGYFGAEMTY